MGSSITTSLSGQEDKPTAAVVSVAGLSKSFNGSQALCDVTMDFRAGHIHTLMGANGSGKSTLVKLLTGAERADRGTITARGQQVVGGMQSPQEAQLLGFRVVHQEAPLIDTMSVAEVVALHLGYPTFMGGLVRWRKVPEAARECMHRVGLDVAPARLAGTLSASERALLAISIALATAPDQITLLILDEATAKIALEEARRLLEKVRVLAHDGLAVLMVTHRVAEAAEFGDQLAVLEAGEAVYSGPMPKDGDMVYRLLRQVASASPKRTAPEETLSQGTEASGPVWASAIRGLAAGTKAPQKKGVGVEDLWTATLRGVDFTLQPGEMVGIVGGPRSGVQEVPWALAGLDKLARGRLRLGENTARLPRTPKEALRLGIALVPSDRLHHGAVGMMSIFENIVLPKARGFRYWTSPNKRMVANLMGAFAVVPDNPNYLVSTLSGGNQQKVIVGKWLSTQPELLILNDPTVGVDPWSRERLFEVVRNYCETGLRVLLLSSEPEQLVEHCSRVLAIDGGLIMEELTGTDICDRNVAVWSMA